MKKLFAIISTLLAAATAVQGQSSARFYIEPSVVYVFPSGFEGVAGGALAFGAAFYSNHSVEVEVVRYQTKDKDIPAVEVKFTPILVNYKYTLQLDGNLSGYVGASVGVTTEDPEVRFPYYYYNLQESYTTFTYGMQAGLAYAVSERISLHFGVKVLRLNETKITTEGNIALLSAGVNFRF